MFISQKFKIIQGYMESLRPAWAKVTVIAGEGGGEKGRIT